MYKIVSCTCVYSHKVTSESIQIYFIHNVNNHLKLLGPLDKCKYKLSNYLLQFFFENYFTGGT